MEKDFFDVGSELFYSPTPGGGGSALSDRRFIKVTAAYKQARTHVQAHTHAHTHNTRERKHISHVIPFIKKVQKPRNSVVEATAAESAKKPVAHP